jgi:hypothetical protein
MPTITFPKIKRMSPQFLVANMEKSIEFYITMLGSELEFRYENFYAGILKDGFSIHLKTAILAPKKEKTRKKMKTLILSFPLKALTAYTTAF